MWRIPPSPRWCNFDWMWNVKDTTHPPPISPWQLRVEVTCTMWRRIHPPNPNQSLAVESWSDMCDVEDDTPTHPRSFGILIPQGLGSLDLKRKHFLEKCKHYLKRKYSKWWYLDKTAKLIIIPIIWYSRSLSSMWTRFQDRCSHCLDNKSVIWLLA